MMSFTPLACMQSTLCMCTCGVVDLCCSALQCTAANVAALFPPQIIKVEVFSLNLCVNDHISANEGAMIVG